MKPDGTETKGIRALRFLKPPPCGFPWVVDHFISEIADCTQQPEIPPSLWPPAPAVLPPLPPTPCPLKKLMALFCSKYKQEVYSPPRLYTSLYFDTFSYLY